MSKTIKEQITKIITHEPEEYMSMKLEFICQEVAMEFCLWYEKNKPELHHLAGMDDVFEFFKKEKGL